MAGSLINSVIDKAFGWESTSTVEKFMSKFQNAAGHYVDQIDTLNTFDCIFQFWPGKDGGGSRNDTWSAIGEKALGNLVSNVTVGLVDLNSGDGIVKKQKNALGNGGKTTFMNYLLKSNLYEVDESGPNVELDMSYYIQNMTTPNINIATGEQITSPIGTFNVTGSSVTLQTNTLNMEILNTKAPLMERIFYPWMREVSLPMWSYVTQPYTTADIRVSMKKHADVTYYFVNARPVLIDTYNPSQELNGSPTRNVSFVFDYMFIDSELKIAQTAKEKLRELGGSMLKDVAGTFGL